MAALRSRIKSASIFRTIVCTSFPGSECSDVVVSSSFYTKASCGAGVSAVADQLASGFTFYVTLGERNRKFNYLVRSSYFFMRFSLLV